VRATLVPPAATDSSDSRPAAPPAAAPPRARAPAFPARAAYGALALGLGAALAAVLLAGGAGGTQALALGLAPDLPLLAGGPPGGARGQLRPRAVPLYNAVHHLAGPLLLGAAAALGLLGPDRAWLAGALAWAAHLALDRALGFGPRTPEGLQRA
jgi:hypothetical protein